MRAAVGDERLLLGELYLPIERLVAYYASGLDMPANFHLLTHAVDAARDRRAGRALRGRAARRRLAELGARQPRPPAARDPARARPGARRRVPAADPARHADALLRRRARHARRRDRARAARRPVGLRQPRPGAARRCSGTPDGSFTTGEPWLPFAPDHATVNVEAQRDDPDSLLRSTAACSRCAAREPDLVDRRLPDARGRRRRPALRARRLARGHDRLRRRRRRILKDGRKVRARTGDRRVKMR